MTERFVALGASNLARMMLPLLDAMRAAAAGPIEAHAALGRGRSFGIPSRMLGRGLGGIDGCGLWPTLAARNDGRSGTALLMDVGNDLLYGVDVERILGWVDAALRRLVTQAERVVVVGLPITSLRHLDAWRFAFVTRVLVPSCRLTLASALDGAARLDAGLRHLARERGATFHEPRPEWYGFDPIHVRTKFWRTAANEWLGAPPTMAGPRIDGIVERVKFLFAAPVERTLFGVRRVCAQPARRWHDGTTLSLW